MFENPTVEFGQELRRENNSSPGPRGVNLELLKYRDKSIIRVLTLLYNRMLTGDRTFK